MIEILEKENITGQDIKKVKEAKHLIIEDRLFISYEESSKLFTELLKQLDSKRMIMILSGDDFNIIDIVKACIDEEIKKLIEKRGNG